MIEPVQSRVEKLIQIAIQVEKIEPDADLIGGGMMDSLALVALITDIEDEFGVELPLDDFDIEAFRTIDSITAFVSGALAGEPIK